MPVRQTVLKLVQNLPFVPCPNTVRLLRVETLPPRTLITSALGLFFAGEALLMSNLVRRGWDIPGGHVEPGETPEETVRREVYEETGAELGPLRLFAVQQIEIAAPCPPGYPYPYPISYQVFYCGAVTRLGAFRATDEVRERGLFEPAQARQSDWVQDHPEMYAAAREVIMGLENG